MVDPKDVRYTYSLGQPMTREQMERQVAEEQQQPPTDDPNPHEFLFTDAPPNSCAVAAISYLHPDARQKHESEKCFMKIRGAFANEEKATVMIKRVVDLQNDENTDIFVVPLYQFFSLPALNLDAETNDDTLNDALKRHKADCVANTQTFHARKQQMLDDVKRQNEIRERIRNGELDEADATSEAVIKDPVVHDAPPRQPEKMMESSDALNDFAHLVCVCVSTTINNRDHVIVKLCAAFKTNMEADTHAKRLSQDPRYQHYDVHVTSTGEWLQIPPPKHLLPTIEYRDNKLTEALGVLNKGAIQVQALQNSLKEPEDVVGSTSSDNA